MTHMNLPDKTTGANGGYTDRQLIEYCNIKLAARGCPIYGRPEDYPFLDLGGAMLANFREKLRLLSTYLCPADQRLQSFLDEFLREASSAGVARLPADTFILDRAGLARVLSLPPDRDVFESDIVRSYRVKQGVLHNPKADRRTTKGVFHICEGGFPIPADKVAVSRPVFARMLQHALNPPKELLRLPFTDSQAGRAEVFVSLLLRPVVCPAVEGFTSEKTMEIRFFAPGNLVGNLDFVETIFGNGGDPSLPENDAALDIEHWTGHTGGVLLAPHLVRLTKKELGLPHLSEATERQKRDGQCWDRDDERYNDGQAFKLTARDKRGVIFTLIADNYFGYCKKEVKTQLSFAANLYGLCEEEHAGGAVAFSSYDLGEDFALSRFNPVVNHSFVENVMLHGALLDVRPEGYAVDRTWPDIVFIPEDSRVFLREQQITWTCNGQPQSIKLLPNRTYVLPSGYKVEMVKPADGRHWRLIGTSAEGTFCHKPCTVSGGGKSEISKSIADAIIAGPVFVADFQKDMAQADEIIRRDYDNRFKDSVQHHYRHRPLLSSERSLGSVIKLLTPSEQYTGEYNAWLRSIPRHVRDLVLSLKRFYRPDWGDDWRRFFSVDIINGVPGHELKYRNQRLVALYLRVGFMRDGLWRTFGLRKDFSPAAKLQMEDDITASVVVPQADTQRLHPEYEQPAYKFVVNCERYLFQRPDEAIHRGYDRHTEHDFSRPGGFFSNYQPMTREDARQMVEDSIGFAEFTAPIRATITEFLAVDQPRFFVCPANPRLVDGQPSRNPRYLQFRPDLANPRLRYLCELGTRLYRRIAPGSPVPFPVNAVLPGRRNNPPEPNLRPLCMFNPIHYQELPELFMDFIASLTGKSPSTTGAGSEGALTKGPFNALPQIIDLNNALASFILTDYAAFTTAAGYVGPDYRVDHDLSLLVPELWARMSVNERTPAFLIKNGYLERCADFDHQGKRVLASRLGWRINELFVRDFFGRVFSNPDAVLTPDLLRPELQSLDIFADGVDNLVTAQRNVALQYFEDGTIELACPPLEALLHIMAHGQWKGKGVDDPEVRRQFTRKALLASEWYAARLDARQRSTGQLWEHHVQALQAFLGRETHETEAQRLHIRERLTVATHEWERVRSAEYRRSLIGTLGTDPAAR